VPKDWDEIINRVQIWHSDLALGDTRHWSDPNMWVLISECSLSLCHFSFMVSELSCFLSCSCGNSLLVSKLMGFLGGFNGKSLLFSHISKLFNVGFLCSFKLLLMSFSFGFSLFHSFFSS